MQHGRKTSIYVSDDFLRKIGVVENGKKRISKAIALVLERYSFLVRTEQNHILISRLFSEKEWELMRAVCSGVEWEPAEIICDGVLRRVKKALDIEFEVMKVDRKALTEKLEKLTLNQQFALVEEIELFWEKIYAETEGAKNA